MGKKVKRARQVMRKSAEPSKNKKGGKVDNLPAVKGKDGKYTFKQAKRRKKGNKSDITLWPSDPAKKRNAEGIKPIQQMQ